MSPRYPLQTLLITQNRRVERALGELAAAQAAARRCQAESSLAQQALDDAHAAHRQLQRTSARHCEQATSGEAALSCAQLLAPALHLDLLRDRAAACARAKETAAEAEAEAESALQRARAAYRRAQAKQQALLKHQAAWKSERAAQRLRSEDAVSDDVLASRYLQRGAS